MEDSFCIDGCTLEMETSWLKTIITARYCFDGGRCLLVPVLMIFLAFPMALLLSHYEWMLLPCIVINVLLDVSVEDMKAMACLRAHTHGLVQWVCQNQHVTCRGLLGVLIPSVVGCDEHLPCVILCQICAWRESIGLHPNGWLDKVPWLNDHL